MSGRGTKRNAAAAGMQATPTPATKISLSLPKSAKGAASDERPSKRIKTPMGAATPASATPASPATGATSDVQTSCRNMINHLKKAADKTGRQFCEAFLTLPDPDDLLEYYEIVKLPIAFDTLEDKIEKGEYASLDQLDSDIKRLVLNAKKFNQTQSQIFEDAERIRKATYNWMHKHNPSYKDKSHQAVPTPEPETLDPDTVKALRARAKLDKPAASPLAQRQMAQSHSKNQPAASAPEPQSDDPTSFVGKTFQQAQEMIITSCMEFQDSDSGLEIFTPFVDLPSKKDLRDYYQIIQDPQCLRGVLKRVRGKRETGNTTDLRSWDAFEAEVVKIAENARTYNEDESEMYMLANEFEEYFRQRLAEAKQHVSEPTLKLNLNAKPAGLKIRLGASGGSQKGSPVPPNGTKSASPAINGTPVSVDQQALQRQKTAVQAALNGQVATPQASAHIQKKSPPLPSVKPEQATPGGTPSAGTLQPNGLPNGFNSVMPPPNVRTNSGSIPALPPSVPQPYVPQQLSGIDSKFRQDGKGAAEALLQKLNVSTDPILHVPKPIMISTHAHETLCHQSVTLNLPPAHRQLRLEPTLHHGLVGANGRPWRMFVTANGTRLQPIPQLTTGGRPAYSVSLSPGMNRVEVEVVAAKEKSAEEMEHQGTQTRSKTNELEIERCSVYAHLLRI